MQGEDVRVGIRFDRETARLLKRLAANCFEGNQSMTLRRLIRDEARRAGMAPTAERPATYSAQGR